MLLVADPSLGDVVMFGIAAIAFCFAMWILHR